MNTLQKAVLVIYAALILFVSILWVPQVSTEQWGRHHTADYYHAPIWKASTLSFYDDEHPVVRVDFERWGMEMFAVSAVVAIALIVFQKRRGGK